MKYEIIFTAAWLALALPVHAETATATLVAGTDRTCPAQLPNGTNYEVHHRRLKARWKDQDVYVGVNAYYKPGSGEFLFNSSISSKEAYLRDFKEQAAWTCEPIKGHVVFLENGEWADFWALTEGPRIWVYHSSLRFPSIGQAWRYVSTHFDECALPSPQATCYDEIPLYKELDFGFFRPKSLRFDARPYGYDPLVSVRKAGSTWEVLIKGADEPNRALIILDKNFRLVRITRFTAPK